VFSHPSGFGGLVPGGILLFEDLKRGFPLREVWVIQKTKILFYGVIAN